MYLDFLFTTTLSLNQSVTHQARDGKIASFDVILVYRRLDQVFISLFMMVRGENFPPMQNNEDTDMGSIITTLNTAVTETASDILGKNRQKKKIPWVTAEILDLCDKRRELRNKRFEPEGSEKCKEVKNNIKRCMEKKPG